MAIFDAAWRQYVSTKSTINSYAPKPERGALLEQAKEIYNNKHYTKEDKVTKLASLGSEVYAKWDERTKNSWVRGGTKKA